MQKQNLILATGCFVIGLLLGLLIGGRAMKSASPVVPAGMPATSMPLQSSASLKDLQILANKEPNNFMAQVALGNAYFDAKQPSEAVKAYDRALRIKPNDPDVLTDQGVMYRDLGFYDRAVENFRQAYAKNPGHLQSLFNEAVVYALDLKKPERAKPLLEELLKKQAAGELATQAQQLLKNINMR